MSDNQELLALKKLNMMRLTSLRANNNNELKLAEKLDKYLTKKLQDSGQPMVPESNLGGLRLQQTMQVCSAVSSNGGFAKFVTDKKRT